MFDAFGRRNWLLKKLLSLAGWIAILGFIMWVVNGIAEVEGGRSGGPASPTASMVLDSKSGEK